MKTLIVVCFLLLLSSFVKAEETTITLTGEDCVLIKTRNNTVKVCACGSVSKLDWKELNPNEDVVSWSGTTIDGITLTPYITAEIKETPNEPK